MAKARWDMKKLRFAIIGSGSIAPTHAEALALIPQAELRAVYTRSADKGRQFAARFGCDCYTAYDELLARPDIDAVSLCTPSGTHAALTIAAAKAGKHVIVEKPIDITLEQADAMMEACAAYHVKLGVIFQRRFSPGVLRLKEMLDAGKLGRILYGGCYVKIYRSQEYYDSGAWRGTWAMDGGGVLMNQGIHYIDMLQYLAGPVHEVNGICRTLGHERIDVEDTAVARLEFMSGALGVIEATTNAYPGLVSRIDIYGSEGTAVVENDELVYYKLHSGEEYNHSADAANAGVTSPQVTADNHRRAFAQFIEEIVEGKAITVDGGEGRKALEIVLATYLSAYSGRTVQLPLANSHFLADLAAVSSKAQGFGSL